ncbi:DUF3892 domain-containing protein [Gordonia rhizosphera]|uniref:Uncharacterized protein n=1 Tax=Gordonia rhizosphera NBRC 16068 TaxID=1108045 RepID=K6VAM1_9ACTN|nr:DUF3892 domain-containing protein [Gordonia rhizosphera]GAB93258.1 hypothetical protein GORHZ_213_00330 [Gordonia rhizosphera NBRC 16068]
MENPDTVIELHRTVVEEMFIGRLPPQSIPPQPFEALAVIEGEARLHVAVSRVWFHIDDSGRRWRARDGSTTTDLERHLAFDLRLGDHPAELGLPDSVLVVTKVLGLPVPSGAPTACNGRQIRFNEIPLFGRLVIHDSIERVDTTIDNRPHQNVVIDFAQQSGPTLDADPAGPGASEMFGPDVAQQPGGRVELTGMEPHVVWELTRSEQNCINNSVVGTLLRTAGIDPIDTVAGELAKGVVAKLATLGDNGTSAASLLPTPTPVDPTGSSGDPMQIDGAVRLFTRQASSTAEESMQVQIQTIPVLPEPLPPSVLALSTDETVGFMRAGFALLRSIRASQISSLCLDESDFDPDAGCLLAHPVTIDVNGEDGTLDQFSAVIEFNADLDHEVLNIHGHAEGDGTLYGWFIEFGLVFDLDRGEVPRDPLDGELPPDLQPPRTLAEMNARLRELSAEKCAGGDTDAIEEEQKEIAEEKNALPTEIGVKPQLFGEPFKRSDSHITPLGVLLGIAIGIALGVVGFAIAAAASASIAFTLEGALISAFLIGYPVSVLALAALDDFVIDAKVSDGLDKFVDDKSKPGGDALPLEGYSPTTVLLQDGFLRVFLAPLARRLKVSFFEPDRRRPAGDPDYVSQQVGGFTDDGRLWKLTIADAAHLILKDRITLELDPSVTTTGKEVPIVVAHSSRGRRYLRTVGDDSTANNLSNLPRIPTA